MSKRPETSVITELIREIEEVLEDCSQEAPAKAPGRTHDWSPATQRLIEQGLLVDAEGLTLMGDLGAPSLDQLRQAKADLETWRELTAPILEEQNLERARREKAEEDTAAQRTMDQIRATLCELGKWPEDWGKSAQPALLDLYDTLEAPYRAVGRPYGDSLEGLVRWWRAG
jgi:hypothetical protein